MKIILYKITFCAVLLFCSGAYAQVIQKGHVTLMSSGNASVGGVQITAFGASPADSDTGGYFSLVFPSALAGDPVLNLKAYKKGYEVVNAEKLKGWNLSPDIPVKIVMGKCSHLDSLRKVYYNIGESYSQKRYNEAVIRLNSLKAENAISHNMYIHKVDSLNREMESYRLKLEHYSRRFACIDRDNILENEKCALELLDKGDIEGAIKVYEDMDLTEWLQRRVLVMNDNREDFEAILPVLANNFRLLSKKGDLVACDSIANLILSGTGKVEYRIVVAEHYFSTGNSAKAKEIYNNAINDCTGSDQLRIVEESYCNVQDPIVQDDPILGRINERKKFFKLKESFLR